MGKYMRKAKITADVAVMEVSQFTLGVHTRAKALALQRLQSSSFSSTIPPSPSPSSNVPDSSCCLQLRSRRLEKSSPFRPQARRQPITPPNDTCSARSCTQPNSTSSFRPGVGNSSHSASLNEQECSFSVSRPAEEVVLDLDLSVEASFAENKLDFEPTER